VHYEFLDIVEHTSPLSDRGHYAVELVVCEHDLCGSFCDVGTGEAHCDADICGREGGGVVHPIAGHGHVKPATAEREDHTGFGVGCAAGEDEGERRQGIDFGVGEAVEVCGFLDDGGGDLRREDGEVVGDDANFFGDCGGGCGVVALAGY
jgi:hypothetical protein